MLDKDGFEKLVEKTSNVEGTKRDNWYDKSYEVFKKAAKDASYDDVEDLIKLIAYAYSWMPTIPTIKTDILDAKWPEIKVELLKLKNQKECDPKDLIDLLFPIVNNSIVGISKVLHFISPKKIPIIDSNVIRGWNKFFDGQYRISPHIYSNNQKKTIDEYMNYMENINTWAQNSQVKDIRKIEVLLFNYGATKDLGVSR